jgi:hypothetical protein
MQDPLGLAELMGGRKKMKTKLDRYFNGGHNEYDLPTLAPFDA